MPYNNSLLTPRELDHLRHDHAQEFRDRCVIFRPISLGTLDTATGKYTNPIILVLYDHDTTPGLGKKCAISPIKSRRDRFDEVAEGLVFSRQYRLVVPWYIDNIQIRDRVRIVSSADPQMVDREFEFRDVMVQTLLGIRELTVHDFRE